MDNENNYRTIKLPPELNVITYIDSNRFKFIHSENLDNGTLNRIISDLVELYSKLQSFFKVPEVSIPVFIFSDQETFHLFQYGKMDKHLLTPLSNMQLINMAKINCKNIFCQRTRSHMIFLELKKKILLLIGKIGY
ncbi:MAG: hypothetical protein LBE20_05350 [Deltaproteobacteria bacterium]|nr:hypothetical protein [Deltaproteobacteria bacterium]